MITISIDKSNISIVQMYALNRFEDGLTDIVGKLLKRNEYVHLKVLPSFELIRKKNTAPVIISSNASFEIKGSQSLINNIGNWIKQYDDLEVYIPNCTLKIHIHIEEQKEFSSSKDDSLPTFVASEPRYSFHEIILPDDVRKRIMDNISVISKTELVYKTWGWEEIEKTPRLILNFYGKPGTGKTMLAHAISDYFKKPLLDLNYSEIESKYVGDAAKNLKHAFDTAKEMDAVLFFDEADSFLGKRIQNVSQGAEQAINSLRSQMLILLEKHEGIVIFATNLVSNFDKAFESRILDSIEIPMPNLEARAEIIKKKIPSKLPLERPLTDEDFLKASELIDGLAGREIKNAMFKMLLNNADDPNHIFTIDDICDAMKQKKSEIESLHSEIDRQKGVHKINATSEQLGYVKDAMKDSMDKAPTVKI